jgi:glycine/D-amino acid oxidase-like deaminating enzyme
MSAEPVSYWLAASPRGPRRPALRGPAAADIAIVGGGFTGLWTAIQLADAEPGLRIVVLEQEEVGFGASGRNGGFCSASLTHGRANGVLHFPDEIDELQRLGVENLAELCAFVDREGIVCDLERSGAIGVATEPWQAEQFEREARDLPADSALRYYDRAQIQAEVHSPRFLAGFEEGPEHNVMLDPAKLARGLAEAVDRRGVTIHEGTRVGGLERRAGGVRVTTDDGARLDAGRVVVATSAYSGWLRRLVPLFVPVYDYVLVTEPLTADRRASIGWARRQGLSDSGYQFHYFRLTADDRILWGGYDAVYHPGNEVKPDHDRRPATFDMLEAHFRETFPQLGDIGFPYRWGGAIDTSTRFCVTFGETMGGRVVYALGYTGLGVGAARWAGSVVRDWLLRPDSELLKLRLVRSTPFPIPPEPLRTPAVGLMRHEIARADANEGRRSIFLRALDALGIGFDS